MTEVWDSVDEYIGDRLLGEDAELSAALKASTDAGLPAIAVSAAQGRQLTLLAQILGARRILEVGTLAGYSAICLARALPDDGLLVTCEIDPKHTAVARANVEQAGLGKLVDVREGPALETLQSLRDSGAEPFDLFFIDADKEGNADYFALAVQLSRPGSLIIVDNVVRDGEVADADSTSSTIVGTRRLFDVVGAEESVSATAIQTVGDKGYDGFLMAVVDG